MRTVLVIRHAHSIANETDASESLTAEGLALANRSADLSERGRTQCQKMQSTLPNQFGIEIGKESVATSTFVRTRRTARLIGFRSSKPYEQLDEAPYDMSLDELRAMIRRNQVPRSAVTAAEATLRQPPSEKVWITHGLLIAGMCLALGVAGNYTRKVPMQCEARWLVF